MHSSESSGGPGLAFMPYIIYETARTGVTEEPRLAPVPFSIETKAEKDEVRGSEAQRAGRIAAKFWRPAVRPT